MNLGSGDAMALRLRLGLAIFASFLLLAAGLVAVPPRFPKARREEARTVEIQATLRSEAATLASSPNRLPVCPSSISASVAPSSDSSADGPARTMHLRWGSRQSLHRRACAPVAEPSKARRALHSTCHNLRRTFRSDVVDRLGSRARKRQLLVQPHLSLEKGRRCKRSEPHRRRFSLPGSLARRRRRSFMWASSHKSSGAPFCRLLGVPVFVGRGNSLAC